MWYLPGPLGTLRERWFGALPRHLAGLVPADGLLAFAEWLDDVGAVVAADSSCDGGEARKGICEITRAKTQSAEGFLAGRATQGHRRLWAVRRSSVD